MFWMKDMLLQQNEAALHQQIAKADDKTRAIKLSLQQHFAGNNNELVAASPQLKEAKQSRRELLHKLKKQQAANQTFVKMCKEALSQTVYQRTGQKIKGIRATNNSSALTSFINTSREESKINQDISNVNANNYSVAVARVIKNVDFKNLRPNGPNKDQ
ncbi:hypothetical protein SLS59_007080 [Nothophoma quercina]|uniref:Uncharacterized protein n=1 Tax=Nothophoma quercina TaxID=749835 RepID=A0ABR3R0X4_9PLEO